MRMVYLFVDSHTSQCQNNPRARIYQMCVLVDNGSHGSWILMTFNWSFFPIFRHIASWRECGNVHICEYCANFSANRGWQRRQCWCAWWIERERKMCRKLMLFIVIILYVYIQQYIMNEYWFSFNAATNSMVITCTQFKHNLWSWPCMQTDFGTLSVLLFSNSVNFPRNCLRNEWIKTHLCN